MNCNSGTDLHVTKCMIFKKSVIMVQPHSFFSEIKLADLCFKRFLSSDLEMEKMVAEK